MAPVYKIRAADQTITDISSYFRLYKLDVATEAEEGGVAQSTVYADDPTGALDVGGHRIFTVQEDTATGSNTHIYVGYTAGRRVSRGDYRTTTGRIWDIDLVDLNSVLPRRIFDGTRANRPAETDVARIQWLLTTEEASNYVDDDLYVNTTGPVDMDAVDYRGQTVANVIDDAAQASGKNWFVWYREETGEFSLWYDFATSTAYSSPIRLTNVLSEVDEVWTFPISQDTSLSRSPDRVNSGAYLPFDGGTVYTQDLTTAAAFAYRDAVMPAENVKTQAKAQARATRYLGEMDSEEDVITTTVILPKGKVNFLMQGMRVQFKATHLPDYEAYVWGRLLNRSVSQVSEQYYEVKCEIAPTPNPPTLVQYRATTKDGGTGASSEVHLPSTPTEGNLLVAAITIRSGGLAAQGGWTTIDSIDIHQGASNDGWLVVLYRIVPAGQSNVVIFNDGLPSRFVVMEFSGVTTLDTFASTFPAVNTAASVTSGSVSLSGNRVVVAAVTTTGDGVAGGTSIPIFSIDSPFTQLDYGVCEGGQKPTHAVGYRILTPASGATTFSSTHTVGGFTTSGYVATIISAYEA